MNKDRFYEHSIDNIQDYSRDYFRGFYYIESPTLTAYRTDKIIIFV